MVACKQLTLSPFRREPPARGGQLSSDAAVRACCIVTKLVKPSVGATAQAMGARDRGRGSGSTVGGKDSEGGRSTDTRLRSGVRFTLAGDEAMLTALWISSSGGHGERPTFPSE
ncbi:hypothetical protein GCM10011583_54970 [Streptomyces camponoticapitis]|uniref:Uncharacterized protein n=1 Tax=Streptomyces camponoticapitis TaxID=1616125 RepID=A0ABQ2ELZ6_9ACTN|nr:hypothetical protein GCM10011583_54970 [Streptomyces camponoticapitis]